MELSTVTRGQSATLSFTVKNFSNLIYWTRSPSLVFQGIPFQIKVRRNQDYLAFYVQCCGRYNTLTYCPIDIEFRIKNSKHCDFIFKRTHIFTVIEPDVGHSDCLSWSHLVNPLSGFIVDDKVTFEITITADSPIATLQVNSSSTELVFF